MDHTDSEKLGLLFVQLLIILILTLAIIFA